MKELKQTNMSRGGVLYTRKVKAFTLIELLAVIVILAIIAVIATPIILGVINDSKYKAFKISLGNIEHAYELYAVQKNIKPGTEIDISKLPLDSKNLKGKVFLNSEGKIELKEVTDGTYSAEGTLDDLSVLKGTVDELVKNKLKIDVNLNPKSTSILVTVNRIEGYPTSYSYEITGPNDYSEKVNNKQENTHTFDKLKIDKEYTIKVTAKNKIGLTKEVTKTIKTLKTESSIDIKLSPDDEYIKEGKVTIIYDIKEEGLVGKYKWNEEEFTTANQNTIEIPAKNGTLTAVLMDGEETIISNQITITNIDNMAPVIEKIEGNDNVQSNRKIIKITASDSGVGGIKYSCNDGTTWQDKNECIYNQNGKQKIKVKDSLENISESNEINITTIASEETFTINNLFPDGSFEKGEFSISLKENIEKIEFTTNEHVTGEKSLKIIPIVSSEEQWGCGATKLINNITEGHIYYGTSYCKSRTKCRFVCYSSDWATGGITCGGQPVNSNSSWVKSSFYFNAKLTRNVYFRLGIEKPLDTTLDNENPYYFDDVMLLDLTEIFGKGNEPTKEWCDENINYNTTTIKKYNNSVDIR